MRQGGRLLGALLILALGAALMPGLSGDDSLPRVVRNPVTPHPERPLVESLFDLGGGRLDEALGNLSQLVRRQPDFELAQLIYADLLAIKSGRLDRLGLLAGTAAGLRHEAQARLARYVDSPPPGRAPAEMLRLPEGVGSAILVDLTGFRLYLFANRGSRLELAGDYYVSIGKGGSDKQREGDEKTPVGVYRVSDYLPGSGLPDLYGEGAFPIDYPNPWDRRMGRTGSGIWLHGTESERYSRAPLSSRGCVTLSNADFLALREKVEVGRTPVVVVNGVRWEEPARVEARRAEVAAALERWRRDWESLDTERYLGHYAADFRTAGMDKARFAAHKRRVNQGKSYVRVGLDEIAIYDYPGEEALVLVEFDQSYQSDSFRSRRGKQQYWRREPDGWKIVLEARS